MTPINGILTWSLDFQYDPVSGIKIESAIESPKFSMSSD